MPSTLVCATDELSLMNGGRFCDSLLEYAQGLDYLHVGQQEQPRPENLASDIEEWHPDTSPIRTTHDVHFAGRARLWQDEDAQRAWCEE